MIKLAKGAERNVLDYKLSRYACYLIVMNGNPEINIGRNIREVIAKNGGTMPEELPKPDKSLKELEKIKNLPF